MTKLIRTLIIINGFLIPGIALFFLSRFIWELVDFGGGYQNSRVNTNNLVVEDKDTLILQGIEYSQPLHVMNSSNYYIEVNAITYDEPISKSLFKGRVNFEGGSGRSSDLLNVIFLDKDFNPVTTLLNSKAFISAITLKEDEWEQKEDTTIHHVIYKISFKDSNKDGYLDYGDDDDLYISDLDGMNFKQVTGNVDVSSFQIINQGKDVLIAYFERGSDQPWNNPLHFSIYNIQSESLKKLSKVDEAIKEVNKKLVEK